MSDDINGGTTMAERVYMPLADKFGVGNLAIRYTVNWFCSRTGSDSFIEQNEKKSNSACCSMPFFIAIFGERKVGT